MAWVFGVTDSLPFLYSCTHVLLPSLPDHSDEDNGVTQGGEQMGVAGLRKADCLGDHNICEGLCGGSLAGKRCP